jgi:hypothetical protein
MEKSNINKLFGSIGFGFPESINELEEFDNTYEDYEFEGDENKIDPLKILLEISKSSETVTKIDYHKRTVLAAEIVHKLNNEYTLGHLKLQKIMYLCQHTTNMNIHTNFLKQAMGPYDPTLMRSIDKQFITHKWFQYRPNDYPKYKLLEKAGEHKKWYETYFENQLNEIDFIIEKFRKFKTDRVEIIATVFACWKDALENKQLINDELLIQKFYAWSENKAKYTSEEIKNEIEWMLKEGIYPN